MEGIKMFSYFGGALNVGAGIVRKFLIALEQRVIRCRMKTVFYEFIGWLNLRGISTCMG